MHFHEYGSYCGYECKKNGDRKETHTQGSDCFFPMRFLIFHLKPFLFSVFCRSRTKRKKSTASITFWMIKSQSLFSAENEFGRTTFFHRPSIIFNWPFSSFSLPSQYWTPYLPFRVSLICSFDTLTSNILSPYVFSERSFNVPAYEFPFFSRTKVPCQGPPGPSCC